MLRYYRKLDISVIYTLNTSQKNPRRLFAYDHSSKTKVHEFEVSDDCGGAFDLSPNGKLLALGYPYSKGIDIWDVKSEKLLLKFGPSSVSAVIFDRRSKKLLVKTRAETRICDVNTPHDETRVLDSGRLRDGCFVLGKNQYLIPSRRRGTIMRVDFDSAITVTIDVPIKQGVRYLRHSPIARAFFAIDNSGFIWCFDSSVTRQLWKTDLQLSPGSRIYVGEYSGNGKWIGVSAAHANDSDETIVLDAETGKTIHAIKGVACFGYPYGQDSVLDPGGEILNLKTKRRSKGLYTITDYLHGPDGDFARRLTSLE